MTGPTYTKGERVRFNTNNLGVMRDPYGGPKSVLPDVIVNAGDIGSYVEPSTVLGDEDWHIIAVNPLPNVTGYVPVHASMFELAAES